MLNLMESFNEVAPGRNVLRVLLYFEDINKYYIDDVQGWRSGLPYYFIEAIDKYHDGKIQPSHWLNLD